MYKSLLILLEHIVELNAKVLIPSVDRKGLEDTTKNLLEIVYSSGVSKLVVFTALLSALRGFYEVEIKSDVFADPERN